MSIPDPAASTAEFSESTEAAPPVTEDESIDAAMARLHEAPDLHERAESADALLATLRGRLEDVTQ